MNIEDLKTTNDKKALVTTIIDARHHYYNTDAELISDVDYDHLEARLKVLDPTHPLFSEIGAKTTNSVELPFKMCGLVQNKYDQLQNFATEEVVISSKMDGVSGLLIYEQGKFVKAYTRGNGMEAQDITSTVKKMNIPLTIIPEIKAVRVEFIMAKPDLLEYSATYKHYELMKGVGKSNEVLDKILRKPYIKNCRNAIAGIINKKKIEDWKLAFVEIFALETISCVLPITKSESFKMLKDNGFTIPNYTFYNELPSEQDLKALITYNKEKSDIKNFEQDGLVIDINTHESRHRLGITDLEVNFARKFKVNDESVNAIVFMVEWNVSKNNVWIPTILLEAFDLNGVTIKRTSGFNAAYIEANQIGPGTVVKMVRSGDVIPYITGLVKSTRAMMPGGKWEWDNNHVDAHPTEITEESLIQKLLFFVQKRGIKHLGESGIRKLYAAGITDFQILLKTDLTVFNEIIGANGIKAWNQLKASTIGANEANFAAATGLFGTGVGERVLQSVLDAHATLSVDDSELISVDGIEEVTATKILDGIDSYNHAVEELGITFNVADISDDVPLKDKNIVFSSFRDEKMKSMIEYLGGSVKSSVSKNTDIVVTKDVTSTTGKVAKARDLNIEIISVEDFNTTLEKLS
jgi:NAD-dependent DNA ligase